MYSNKLLNYCTGITLSIISFYACADLPEKAHIYLPTVIQETKLIWPNNKYPWFIPAQIEQESCITLKHKKCWNPNVELKTSIEYGFGLGQITISYNSDGSVRTDNFSAIKKLNNKLKAWKWEDRFNPEYQINAIVSYDKHLYDLIKFNTFDELEKQAFMFSSYNGGYGNVLKDIKICSSKEECDSSKWFNNVELYSYRNKKAVSGYKKSFFEINREYVRNIMFNRYKKYISYYG